MDNEKNRTIQEYVPGKQVTLAHIIANPDEEIYRKVGLNPDNKNAIGIMTITPSEGAIIAADVATKAGEIEIGFIDRFTGSLVIVGDVSSIEYAINEILQVLNQLLGFSAASITKT